jgi:hypothetical protein
MGMQKSKTCLLGAQGGCGIFTYRVRGVSLTGTAMKYTSGNFHLPCTHDYTYGDWIHFRLGMWLGIVDGYQVRRSPKFHLPGTQGGCEIFIFRVRGEEIRFRLAVLYCI